jgi:hypothetical protein
MRHFIWIAVAAVLLPSSSAVRAQDMVKSLTQDRVAELLQDAGYRAAVVPSQPRPYVRTSAGGHNVLVLFYDCRDGGCAAIQFGVGLRKSPKFTPALANQWNSERRYAKTHIASNGDLRVTYDIDLRAGVSAAVVKQGLLQFELLLARLDEFIRSAPTVATAPGSDIAGKARDAEALSAQGKYIEAVAALTEATSALWAKSPLTFRRALWVAAPPEGFGVYNPRENNVYGSGAKMIAYAEPVGFGWRQSGEVYQTDLAIDIVVKDKTGAELLRRSDFSGMKLGSRVQNREFMATFTYTFSGIPAGEYVLDTIVRDKVSGKSGTFSLPFVVR